MNTRKIGKGCLALLLSVVMTVTAFPQMAAAASDSGQSVKLEEGTYVPGQVIVMFRNDVIEDSGDSVKEARAMAQVGSDFGRMSGAVSESAAAAGIAESEVDLIDNSLGKDFVVEDTLIFAADGSSGDAGGGIGIASSDEDEGFSVALISSDRYDTATMIEKLSKNRNVAAAEPNYRTYLTDIDGFDSYSLNDKYSRWLYQDNAPAAVNKKGESVDARGFEPDAAVSVNAASAWKKLTGKEKEVVVAVVDSGVNPDHEDLKYRLWTNPGDIGLAGKHGYNFADNSTDISDHDGHGTHCAGLIAAQADNGRGVAGVAGGGNVKLMILDTNPSATEGSMFVAMGSYNYVLKAKAAGVNVVATSNSWGRNDTQSTIFDEIIDKMGRAGIISFYAAGNDHANSDLATYNPSSSNSDYSIVVGAAGISGEPAGFSNYGRQTVDVFAPGLNTLSTIGGSVYFPTIYTRSERRDNTEYYGQFTGDSKVRNGTVKPETGDTLLSSVKSFDAMEFRKQPAEYYGDDETAPSVPDSARCEVEVVQDHYFNIATKAALKVTIRNAQYGEVYYVYFPYKKNRKAADDNTRFSIMYQSGENSSKGYAYINGGEVIVDEDGTCSLTGGGLNGHALDSTTVGLDTHIWSEESDPDSENARHMVCDYSELGKSSCGIGLQITPEQSTDEADWQNGASHDLVFYIDSIGVSKPGADIDENTSYEMLSGTSMACPSAAGAGALMALMNPAKQGQSGAEYASMIRNKLFESVHKTDALEGLCSTGGYIDLRYMNSGQPVINDAVCSLGNDTLTLKGKNLSEGSTLTYRQLSKGGSEAVELPSGGMDLTYSADGSSVVISNARKLFGTYLEFVITSADGQSGKGSFFTVKGQKKLQLVASKLFPHPNQSDYYDYSFIQLATDSKGSRLYAVENDTAKLMRFNGRDFEEVKGTDLVEVVKKNLEDQGYDPYEIGNSFDISPSKDTALMNDGDMIYYRVYVTYTAADDSEESTYTQNLASMDLSAADPQWKISTFAEPPVDDDYKYINSHYMAANGKIYCMYFGDEKKDYTLFYSYDPADNSWTKEESMPGFIYEPYTTTFDGCIYSMFGSRRAGDSGKKEDHISDAVYRFDGSSWKRTGTLTYAGKRDSGSGSQYPEYTASAARSGNGLVLLDMAIEGAGNSSIYDPLSDKVTPIYYTINDGFSDMTLYDCRSSVATQKGIYYLRDNNNEMQRGWGLYLLPASSGVYDSIYGPADTDSSKAARVRKTRVSLKSVKAGSRKLTVRWKANKSVFGGYQIRYRIKGRSWKTVTVKKASAAGKVIKKLKKGKKYQVKVRGYKVIGGTRVYGKFSKVRTSSRIR